MRGQRVGEASHPGPATHPVRRVRDSPESEHVEVRRGTRRRRQLRPLPWSWDDTDTESDADRNVVPRTDGEVPATVPASQTALHEVGRRVSPEQVPLHDSDAFEEDMDHGGARFGRRVVLHPQSSGGTPGSVQDRSPNMSMRGNRFAALGTETVAVPTSGHSVPRAHRLVLVNSGDVVESSPRVRVEPAVDAGNVFVGVAVPALDAVVPARESGLVEIDIARDDSDGFEQDTESINVESDQPETPRMQGVEHSSAADSDEEGPHEADEVIETVEEELKWRYLRDQG